MAIIWGAVKDHEGYIDIESEIDRGTTVSIYFPVTRQEAAPTGSEHFRVSDYRGDNEKILIVDDIASQREVAGSMLENLNYQVTAVASGEEALAYLKDQTADLLILDMIMDNGIDGLETYKRLLEINPKQKAIIASGFSETDRVREVQQLGAGAYIRKPFTLEVLVKAVKSALKE
jgi:CheY-like chemotaxis protein